jgi:hypothetical protein
MRKATIYYNDQPIKRIEVTKTIKELGYILLHNEDKIVAIVPDNYLIIFTDER